jgi:hypothetical protein
MMHLSPCSAFGSCSKNEDDYILLPQRTSVYDEQFKVGVTEAYKIVKIEILYKHIQVSGASCSVYLNHFKTYSTNGTQ